MKVTRGLYRKDAGLQLGADTIDSVAEQLSVIRLSVRLVGQPTEALHESEGGGGKAGLVPLLGGDPVDLRDGGLGVQVTVHYGHPAVVHRNLVVVQRLVVALRPV